MALYTSALCIIDLNYQNKIFIPIKGPQETKNYM